MNPAIEILLEKLLKTAEFLKGETPKKIYLEQLRSLHGLLKEAPDGEVKTVVRERRVEVLPYEVQERLSFLEKELDRERRGKTARQMGWEDKEGLRLQSLIEARTKWADHY